MHCLSATTLNGAQESLQPPGPQLLGRLSSLLQPAQAHLQPVESGAQGTSAGAAAKQDILLLLTFGDLVPSVDTEGSWNSVMLWRVRCPVIGPLIIAGLHRDPFQIPLLDALCSRVAQAGQGRGGQLGGDSKEPGCSSVNREAGAHRWPGSYREVFWVEGIPSRFRRWTSL